MRQTPAPLPPLPAGFDREAEFPIVRRWNFLNHAAVAPVSARAGAALAKYIREATEDSYLAGRWYEQADDVRALAARLVHAESDEIAFVKNTSEGLAFVANGLDWRAGDEVVGTGVEYPANVYPWMDVAQRFGARFIQVPERDGRIDPDELLAALSPRTRLLALSHVEYASGFRNDIARIGAECRRRGVLFCVDAIQSVGALPVDVRAMNIDYLSADGHKWMLAPEGCGFFYCRRELITALRPEVGWLNVVNATDYGSYDFTLQSSARRFECGSYTIPCILALGASLKLILELGMDVISTRILGLTARARAGLEELGFPIIGATRGESELNGILAFHHPTLDAKRVVGRLLQDKIVVAAREGRVRISPHFYNTEEQIDALLAALRAL